MFLRISFLLPVLLISSILFAQTPEQSYFEWTDMPFPKEELVQRRIKLISILKNQKKTGLVLIPARDGCEVLSKALPRTTEGLESLMVR